MLFNSYDYLLYFLPLSLVGFFALGRRPTWAVAWLVAASLFFYAWWDPRYLPLILGSIGFNFIVGRALRRRPPRARVVLGCGIAANLLLLGVFKYADFALDNAGKLLGTTLPLPHIILPLGISFFTFTQIAYLVDVYRDKAREPSLANYALFVSFFPHLLAGPILHHSEMMPQFASATNKRAQGANLAAGLFLLAIGLVKKVCFADQLAPLAEAGFDHPAALTTAGAWLAVLAYTLQIYFDFSGYTDMALGAARMFNIVLPINFDSPYHSTSIREFWQRWHITLSRFLREYLYVPLGGNRRGLSRMLFAVMTTFLLGGLWHGAAWNFVVWGALHGAALVCYRAWHGLGLRMPRPLAWLVTMLFVMIAWVFFRAQSLPAALAVLQAMAGLNAGAASAPAADLWAAALLAAGVAVVALRRNSNAMAREFRPAWPSAIAVTAGLVASILQLGKVAPFIYFNF
jgi:alginate O-acetyltransferase complex protein AlgI